MFDRRPHQDQSGSRPAVVASAVPGRLPAGVGDIVFQLWDALRDGSRGVLRRLRRSA